MFLTNFDYIYIGETPAEENCEQVGDNYNPSRARAECKAFINQIRREFGPEPQGARLRIKTENHDFGSYLSVICQYACDNQTAADYAYQVECPAPRWDDEARKELGL